MKLLQRRCVQSFHIREAAGTNLWLPDQFFLLSRYLDLREPERNPSQEVWQKKGYSLSGSEGLVAHISR